MWRSMMMAGVLALGALPMAALANSEMPAAVKAEVSDACVISDATTGLAPRHASVKGWLPGEVWLVPCSIGAYQTGYEAVFAPDGGTPRALLFALWRDGSWTGTRTLFDPEFDAQHGILRDRYKDRGAGGCGGERTWVWQGSDFQLTEYRAQPNCESGQTRYPVVFEAK
ncbi:hypothetical protein GY26_12335 [Gammaproteobacteria bacterium MFB021]|nr:hypothetical protein GY26_12335 [Gammaproteobacteria bacterium MFB021]